MTDFVEVPTDEWANSTQDRLDGIDQAIDRLAERVAALEAGTDPADLPSPPEPEPDHRVLVGTSVPWFISFADMEQITGGFSVRRVYDPGVPRSFASSGLRHDNGARWQVWSFKPDIAAPESHDYNALFESIPDRSRVYVVPYHEPADNMSSAQYKRLYNAVLRAYLDFDDFAGIGTCLTNFSITHQGGLSYVQPEKSDFLSVDIYADYDNTAVPFKSPVDSMAQAIDYANDHSLPFAVDEFGVHIDESHSAGWESAQIEWLDSMRELSEHVRLDRLVYWSGSIDNMNSSLTASSRVQGAWKRLRDSLDPRP